MQNFIKLSALIHELRVKKGNTAESSPKNPWFSPNYFPSSDLSQSLHALGMIAIRTFRGCEFEIDGLKS